MAKKQPKKNGKKTAKKWQTKSKQRRLVTNKHQNHNLWRFACFFISFFIYLILLSTFFQKFFFIFAN